MTIVHLALVAVVAFAANGCGTEGGSDGSGGSAATGGSGGTGGDGGAGGNEPPGPPVEGLQVFLTFDGDASDQSLSGNDGALVGGATASGELLLGDNATDLLMLPGSVMDGLGDFTFGAWLRIDALRDENHEVISGANAAEDNALSFWYREMTDEWVVGVNNSSSVLATDATIEDQQWHHVTLTRSGSTARLYFGGTPLGDPVTVDAAALDIEPGGLVFGQDQDEVGGGYEADEAWAGAMDNLRIYDRALSVEEVALLAAEPR